jgi:hypothetical protein
VKASWLRLVGEGVTAEGSGLESERLKWSACLGSAGVPTTRPIPPQTSPQPCPQTRLGWGTADPTPTSLAITAFGWGREGGEDVGCRRTSMIDEGLGKKARSPAPRYRKCVGILREPATRSRNRCLHPDLAPAMSMQSSWTLRNENASFLLHIQIPSAVRFRFETECVITIAPPSACVVCGITSGAFSHLPH